MRIYRARNDLVFTRENKVETTVFKDQVFFVDSYTDLPCFNDEQNVKLCWQELGLHNNYGTIELRGKV